jgi:hypothetical protein
MAYLARILFDDLPGVFLPLYKTIQSQYADLTANPNLRRLINDNRAALTHLGLYFGFLVAEGIRADRRNVTLILTVGVVNGLGWAACQNWRWAAGLWPTASFNWWRCWESCGGISIGIAYGLAYYLTNRQMSPAERAVPGSRWAEDCPNLERLGAYLGLLLGLGFSIRNGLKGWANIYLGHEQYWGQVFWWIIGPLILMFLFAIVLRLRLHPLPANFRGDVFPHDYQLIWLVVVTQNVIAQLVTGPHSVWNEVAFNIYYILLFFISAVILHHFHCLARCN